VLRTTSGKADRGGIGLVAMASVWDEPVRSSIASRSPPASPGEAGAAATAETRGRLGSTFRKSNQPRDPGSPCCARRPGKQTGAGLALSQWRLSGTSRCDRATAHCFPPASPGGAGASAAAQTRGRLGSILANQTNHAIPDRRAAHVVRESKWGVGWLCCNCVCLGQAGAIEPPLTASHLRPRAKTARQRRRRPGVAWDRLSANQINHVIPARRAPHDVRESRLWVG
jgi:hypothetical protein